MANNILDDEINEEKTPSSQAEEKQDIHKGSWITSVISKGKWYLFASIFAKAVGFFLIPIYTRHLTTSEYGILENINTISQFLPVLLSLSIDAAFVRFFHDYKKDKSQLSLLYSSVFWFVVAFGGIILTLFIASTFFWIEDLMEIPVYPYILLGFIPALFAQLNQLSVRFLEQSLEVRTVSLVTVITSIVNMGLSVILLVEFDLGVMARLWGIAIAIAVNFIFLIHLFIRRGILRFHFNARMLREALLYSAPLIFMQASNWINAVSDRLIVTKYVDTAAVGLYSLAFQFGFIAFIVGNAVTQVLMPISMSGLIADKENTKKKMSDYGLLMWYIMIVINMGLLLFSEDVIRLMTDKAFHEAYIAIPILSAPYLFGMQYRFYGVIISYHKKTSFFTLTSLTTATVNLILNFIFVPQYGYLAAAWTTLFSAILYTAMIMGFGLSLERMTIQWGRYAVSSVIFIGVILIFNYFAPNFILKVGMFLIASFLLLLSFGEREKILSLLKNTKAK